MDAKPQPSWVRWLPGIATGAVLLLTYNALIVWPDASDRSGYDAPFTGGWEAILVTSAFLVMCVINVATLFVFVLRGEIRSKAGERIDLIAYSFALAPAIYGLIVSMITDRAILYLPFGAFAFLSIAATYVSLRRTRGGSVASGPG